MRKLTVLIVMALFTVLLVACGDEEEDGGDVVDEAPEVVDVEEEEGAEAPDAGDEAADVDVVETEVVEDEEGEAVEGDAVADVAETEIVEDEEGEAVEDAGADADVAEEVDAVEDDAVADEAEDVAILDLDEIEDVEETDAATPVIVASPLPLATPVAGQVATPVTVLDLEAIADVAVVDEAALVPAATPIAAAAGEALGEGMLTLSGEVTLPGMEGDTYVISAERGCVGLGDFSDVRAGRQLVVRDAAGTIIGVTTLEATDATDECVWSFSLNVPESEFYVLSIPMVTERVLPLEEVEEQDGEVTVPLR